jgi:histidinol-phosphate aminotransferase
LLLKNSWDFMSSSKNLSAASSSQSPLAANGETTASQSRYWSSFVDRLDPYVPGEQPTIPGLIKLNTNENPYPPSPKVMAALSQDLVDLLRLYPDPNSRSLKRAIASNYSVKEKNVFVGNGSDEVLALAFMTFFKQSEPLLFPDISYSFYPVYCNLYGIESVKIPLADDFTIDFEDYKRANGGIIFPNPNAPTGIGVGLDAIEQLLIDNAGSVVIVDEAYIDFMANGNSRGINHSAIALLDRYPNLLVVQTFSKSRSLAGMRVGFAVGSEDLICGLDRVKNSFNSYPLDRVAEVAAVTAMEDVEYFDSCCQKIIDTRDWTVDQLNKLGFEILPSSANFIFAKPTKVKASTLFTHLRDRKILVRYFSDARIDQFLRISIGTNEEMQALIDALVEINATFGY